MRTIFIGVPDSDYDSYGSEWDYYHSHPTIQNPVKGATNYTFGNIEYIFVRESLGFHKQTSDLSTLTEAFTNAFGNKQQINVANVTHDTLPEVSEVLYETADEKHCYKFIKYKGDEDERRRINERERFSLSRIKEREGGVSEGGLEGHVG